MGFLDSHYLLGGATSEAIYSEIKDLPIIDAHNHCDVKALAEDRNFTDIWDAEGSTDHYVWECFRKAGVPEELLTGKEKSNQEKWLAVAEAFGKIAGNPTYEWIHLDLRRRLGINEVICKDTAQAIWDKSKELLAKKEYSQQSMILDMNVEAMCSTDDPVDTLEYHLNVRTKTPAVLYGEAKDEVKIVSETGTSDAKLDTLEDGFYHFVLPAIAGSPQVRAIHLALVRTAPLQGSACDIRSDVTYLLPKGVKMVGSSRNDKLVVDGLGSVEVSIKQSGKKIRVVRNFKIAFAT